MSVLVMKADGQQEPFNARKLVESLKRAGAEESAAHTIEKEVEKELKSGMTTQEIYRRAFAHLREHRRVAAARYSLKRALLEFGPSGFPFEVYLAKLFEHEGYATQVDQILKGACVEHEVDLVLTKGSEIIYVEAKFHNTAGFKTDLKTTLYVKARLDDLFKAGHTGKGLIVTNTKFSGKALQYASCAGLDLLGWEYPHGLTLQDKIEAAKLYPVTALTTLNRREKMALLEQKVVLCRSLPDQTRALSAVGVSGHRAEAVLEEVGGLCTV